jgi:hypothetical protein
MAAQLVASRAVLSSTVLVESRPMCRLTFKSFLRTNHPYFKLSQLKGYSITLLVYCSVDH